MRMGYDHEVEHFDDVISQRVKSQRVVRQNFIPGEIGEARLETTQILQRLGEVLGTPSNMALAERLGVGPSAISNWIKRNTPPVQIMSDIAEQEGLSLDWLLFDVGSARRDAVVPKAATAQGKRLVEFILAWEQSKPTEELVWLEQQMKRAVPEYAEWLASHPAA